MSDYSCTLDTTLFEEEYGSSTVRQANCGFTISKFTYLLTPWCRVLLEKLTGLQLVMKFLAFLWNPKVHYRTHKRPPPVPVLGQPNPVHIPTSHLPQIHPNIIHPSRSVNLTLLISRNVLCYKSEGRWFDPSWCHWNFSLT